MTAFYLHHMGLGQRVLAMSYRCLGSVNPVKLKEDGRGVVEKDLQFDRLLILDCPLKPDSKAVTKELRQTGHVTIMITGNAVLTAAEVARQVGILKKKESATYDLRHKMKGEHSVDVLEGYECVPLRKADQSKLFPIHFLQRASRISYV